MRAMLHRQFVRFLLVGASTVVLDYVSYRLLVALGVAYAPAKAAGFVLGTVYAYFANRWFTFRVPGSRPPSGSALRFGSLYATSLICNVAVNGALLAAFQGNPYVFQLAYVVATAASAAMNFMGMKYLVFRSHVSGARGP